MKKKLDPNTMTLSQANHAEYGSIDYRPLESRARAVHIFCELCMGDFHAKDCKSHSCPLFNFRAPGCKSREAKE